MRLTRDRMQCLDEGHYGACIALMMHPHTDTVMHPCSDATLSFVLKYFGQTLSRVVALTANRPSSDAYKMRLSFENTALWPGSSCAKSCEEATVI